MPTAVQIVNRALQEIGSQSQISSFSDTTPEAVAANAVYEGILESVLRQSHWDSVRKEASLILSGNTAPVPWSFEYLYPSDGVQLRQVMGTTVSQFDPQPIRWAVGTAIVSTVATKVIWTNQSSAIAVYTAAVSEEDYDPLLVEAIVKALGNALAMSITGRPDFAKELLEESLTMIQIGEARDY